MCKATLQKTFKADDMHPSTCWGQNDFWRRFAEWLYTSNTTIQSTTTTEGCYNTWLAGEKITAPRFTNYVFTKLSAMCGPKPDSEAEIDCTFSIITGFSNSATWLGIRQTSLQTRKPVSNSQPGRFIGEIKSALCSYWPARPGWDWRMPEYKKSSTADKDGVNKVVLTSRLLLVSSG